jgi:hypothetical protein
MIIGCVFGKGVVLFFGCALTAHALACLGNLGEDILTGNISHPQHAKADGKVSSISPKPASCGSYHDNGFVHDTLPTGDEMSCVGSRNGRINTRPKKQEAVGFCRKESDDGGV